MQSGDPTIVINYPNTVGVMRRYDLKDQRAYFTQFDIGVYDVFRLSLENIIAGDLLNYSKTCNAIFDNHCKLMFRDNTIKLNDYNTNKKEFNRRIFDVYRYAYSSLETLGKTPFTQVVPLSQNTQLDIGSFVLR